MNRYIKIYSYIHISKRAPCTMATVKKIHIYIPKGENLPPGFSDMSPEDTLIVIKGGYTAFQSAKEDMQLLSNADIHRTIRAEIESAHETDLKTWKERTEKLEKDLAVQQELYKSMMVVSEENGEKQMAKRVETYDRLQQSYREEREHMQNRIISLETQIATTNAKVREEAMQLVNRELENLKHILAEKDKQTATIKGSLDKAVEKIDTMTQRKTTVSLGKMGEKQFDEIARIAFRDFDAFEIEDMHSVAGQGDFHLKFKSFTILADSKLYTNKVSSTSRDKIKRDLKKNEHIQFAWLVSLDTTIDKFDKAPFMFEWLSEHKCVCYINELLKHDEPIELLRAVWYCCNTLYSIMTSDATVSGNKEITRLREHELKIKEIAQKMVKNNRERETILTQLRGNFDKNDEHIREILNEETNRLIGDYYGIVVSWWNKHMTEQNSTLDGVLAEPISSSSLWTQFKKDNESNISQMDCNSFKDILMTIVAEKNLVKPKSKTGAVKILNYMYKTISCDSSPAIK